MPFCERPDTRVHYEVSGEGPPVVLVNGLTASAFLWPTPWLERLEADHRVIRVSNRGTGHTDPGEGITIDAMAGDVAAVLDHEDVESADVVGFSMGGMVAQTVFFEQPSRVRSLVLSSTTTGGENDVHPEFAEAIAEMSRSTRNAAASLFPLIAAPGFWEERPDALADIAQAWQEAPTPPDTGAAQLVAAAAFDSRDRLGDVGVPTLVLHGLEDRLLVPDGGRRLAAGIPGARLETYAGVGHMLAYEAAESAELVSQFLAG